MTEARYHRVRGLEKGLAVLRAMNRLGEASAASVAGTTGLPRPTAHRLLETLLATGYVARGRVRGTYRLTNAPVVARRRRPIVRRSATAARVEAAP